MVFIDWVDDWEFGPCESEVFLGDVLEMIDILA